MSRTIAVLRPEPGNTATAIRIEQAGRSALRLPLFVVRPHPWQAPDPGAFDAVLLTSANAVRCGGAALEQLQGLPAVAVGASTATAASAAGFAVAVTGDGGVNAALRAARTQGFTRLLHLAGAHRTRSAEPGIVATREVYTSEALAIAAGRLAALASTVTLLHSRRAARRLAELVTAPADRRRIALAALAAELLPEAGGGWAATAVADQPRDDALLAAAFRLAD